MTWIKSGFQNALPQHVVRPPNNSNASSPRSSQCSNKGTKTFPKSYTAWINLIFGKKKEKQFFWGPTVYSPPPESIASVTEVDLKAARLVKSKIQLISQTFVILYTTCLYFTLRLVFSHALVLSMVTRIVQGLGLSMPQPVLKNKVSEKWLSYINSSRFLKLRRQFDSISIH